MMRALLSAGGGGGAMPLCRDMLPLTFNYNYAMALEIILFCKMSSPMYEQGLLILQRLETVMLKVRLK